MWKRWVTNLQNIQFIWYELWGLTFNIPALPSCFSQLHRCHKLVGALLFKWTQVSTAYMSWILCPSQVPSNGFAPYGASSTDALVVLQPHYSALSCWCFRFCFHIPGKWMRLGWIHSLPFSAELPAVSEGWAAAVSLSQLWLPPPKQTSCHFPIEKANEISRRFAVFMMHLFAFLPFFPFLFFFFF